MRSWLFLVNPLEAGKMNYMNAKGKGSITRGFLRGNKSFDSGSL
jgi:hypothetical protein